VYRCVHIVVMLLALLRTSTASSPAPASIPATRKIESTDAAKDVISQSAKTAGITVALIEPVGNQFRLAFATTTSRMMAFLHLLESTDLALRPETLRINTPKPGTDQLDIELLVAVNVPKPPADRALTACLTTLTTLFPAQGNTIWATSLTNLQNAWQLTGQCTAEKYARDLADRMNADRRFEAARLTVTPPPDASGVSTFTLLFLFKGATPPAVPTTSPATNPRP
jgi:hypothetical protein